MTHLADDLHDALRSLRRSPGLVATVVLSLALGVGANTAVFSFVNAVQFKALPFEDESTLVDIEETSATELCGGCAVGTSYATLLDWQARATTLQSLGAFQETRMVVSGRGEPERVPAAYVTAGLFPMLGIQPVLGRQLTADDERDAAPPALLLSDGLWRRRFNANALVLGTAVKVNGEPHTIVGVMPPGVRFPEFAQFWVPLSAELRAAPRSERSLSVIGRLRPGVDVRAADTQMKTIAEGVAALYPSTSKNWSSRVLRLRDATTSETVTPSIVLLSAGTFVLLIACANVSNLLLVRASERRREISIRMAIGSSRGRIFQLLFVESALLGAAGGLLGLTWAMWGSHAIVAALGTEAPYWIRFGIDARVFAFCAAITLGSGLVFGTLPALHGAKYDPQPGLRDGGASTPDRRARRVADGLVIAQLALALVLLAGAGLLIKSFVRTFQFDPGYDAARILEGDVSLADRRYESPAAIRSFVGTVIEHLERLPDSRAAVSSAVFFRGFAAESRRVQVEGVPTVPEGASPSFYFAVTPGYFRMLGLPVREGREFDAADRATAVVNATMAERLWPGRSALGQRIKFGDRPWLTVIGVTGNTAGTAMRDRAASYAYVPFDLEPGRDLAVMVSTSGNPAALAPELRAAVRAADPDQPLEDVMTMAAALREQAAPARFVGLLMSSLSTVAVGLASIGLYGVTAYAWRRRRREIGIRLALGGTHRTIVRLVLASSARIVVLGLALGLCGAVAGTRLLEGILFGTSPTDPAVLGAVALILGGVACLASYVPARQASRVEPLVVLRNE
ncbi:MAG TPA: ABC transporter permease [Vicinamibacterales bacterium]|jgi:predicted permease